MPPPLHTASHIPVYPAVRSCSRRSCCNSNLEYTISRALQLKRGDPRTSAQVALQLVQNSYPVEVEHFGYTVLQHVVRYAGLLALHLKRRKPVLQHLKLCLLHRWLYSGTRSQMQSIHSWLLPHSPCSQKVSHIPCFAIAFMQPSPCSIQAAGSCTS